MKYDEIYKENNAVFGANPSPIVKMLTERIAVAKHRKALDIGCGQGRDTFFLASQGIAVTAVDSSKVAIDDLNKIIKNQGITNVQTVNTQVENFNIESNTFDIVISINLLHFIKRDAALEIIEKIKKGLTNGGLVAITLFTSQDGFYEQELLRLFDSFKILSYFEGTVTELGHPGQSEKHTHQVARLLAQKIN